MEPLTVLVVQMCSTPDRAANLERVRELVDPAPEADIVALPEVFVVRGNRDDYRGGAETIPGPTTDWLSALATERACWILAGSIIERREGRIHNTSVLVDPGGNVAACYRKIHLFEARLDDGRAIRESDMYDPGDLPQTADINGWCCGLSICYDLRFPELYRRYASEGAHILFAPSDFTQNTGRDHWRTLICARAIENQCFVVAPDQCGANARSGVVSHGHSLVVDPWGTPLSCSGDKEQVSVATLDPTVLAGIRERIPVLSHRRL